MGRIGPILGTIMKLPINVQRLDDTPGILPKKSLEYENSASNLRRYHGAKRDNPIHFLVSQSWRSRQPDHRQSCTDERV